MSERLLTIEDRLEAMVDRLGAIEASQQDTIRRIDAVTARVRAERQQVDA